MTRKARLLKTSIQAISIFRLVIAILIPRLPVGIMTVLMVPSNPINRGFRQFFADFATMRILHAGYAVSLQMFDWWDRPRYDIAAPDEALR